MKILLCILAAALLCGCHRQQWEYRVLRFENSASIERSEAFMVRTNTSEEWLKKSAYADYQSGFFNLEEKPPIAGLKNIEPDLATLGEEGWELVAAVPQTETIGGAKTDLNVAFSNVRTLNIYLIFKRAK